MKKKTKEMIFWIVVLASIVSWVWAGDPIPVVDEIGLPILAYYLKKKFNIELLKE